MALLALLALLQAACRPPARNQTALLDLHTLLHLGEIGEMSPASDGWRGDLHACLPGIDDLQACFSEFWPTSSRVQIVQDACCRYCEVGLKLADEKKS